MAVAAHVILPGVTKEQYDQVRTAVGWLDEPPLGGMSMAISKSPLVAI